jgi:predicted Zn-dependent peptidase
MPLHRVVRTGLVLVLAACLVSPALAAKKKKKGAKAAPAATTATADVIVDHPSMLKYGELDFEVPDAADYRHELSNGIPVYVAEDHDLPLVNVTVVMRLGSFLDPDGKIGVASMTGGMIRRGGTTSRSAEEFDEEVEFLAANIGSFTGDEEGGASMGCITPVLDETLALFFEMLKTPGFQQDRLDVEKDQLLEGMKQRNDNPASISGREWQWLMRGDHFSARRMTTAHLDAISRDDLIAFHRSYWRPENMIVGVSGDVDTKAILAKLEQHFKGWVVEGPAVPWPPAGPTHTPQPGVYRVEKDIPQGRVLIGHLGYQRKDWDDTEPFAIAVMNNILGGGGFTSRLVKRIRSDEGLAYSAGSGYGVLTWWPGVFRISYQSKSPTVAFAAKIALEEMERIRNEPVSEEELRVAKGSFIDVFPRRFESAEDIVGTFVDDEYYGRPHDYWHKYRDRIRAVTREQVQAAAKKHLHPDRLVFLIVGKWADIEPGDADGRASMAEFREGKSTELPLRDPLTLEPMEP